MRQIEKDGRFAVYCDAYAKKGTVIDVHESIANKNIELANDRVIMRANTNVVTSNSVEEKLDITTWLPFAATKYNISPNIDDYFFVPVFTIPSGIPNRNGVAFPLKSLLEFRTDDGYQAYKGFKGMGIHVEHKNDVPAEAIGVVADAFLRQLKGYGGGNVWKLMLLAAIDRTKNVSRASEIIQGRLNSWSMGAFVDKYTCSYCGADVGKCEHIPHNSPVCFYEKDGKLVFKNMSGMKPIELSSVAVPAWSPATSDVLIM